MAETPTAAAPAAPAPAATPAPAAPPAAPAGIPDADALLAMAAGADPPPPADPPADPAKPADPAPKPPDPDPAVTSRLAKIAAAEKRVKDASAKFQAEQKSALEAAANWNKAQEAKTKGERIAALKQLFSDEEITTTLYQELTELVYSGAHPQTGLSKAEAEKLVATKLAEAKKQADDAAAEAARTEKATQEAEALEIQTNYVKGIATVLEANRTKFPHIAAYGVPSAAVLKFTETYFAEHKAAPDADIVLAHFEKDFEARNPRAAQPTALPRPVARGVTESWRSDAPPANGAGRRLSMDEITAESMREAGLT